MLNEKEQIKLITTLVGNAINTGKIKLEPAQIQQIANPT